MMRTRTDHAAPRGFFGIALSSWRHLLMGLGLIMLAGCARSVDETQARACRAVIPALHENSASLIVTRIAPADSSRIIRIDYRARATTGPERAHFLICGFPSDGLGQKKTEIVALRTERGTVTGASLYFMKRFWIDTMEAELALPALPPRAALFGTSSNTVAAAVQHAASAAPLMTMTALLACAYALIYGLAGRILLVFGEFALLGAAATAFGVAVGEMAGIGAPLILLVIGLMVCLWSVAWAGGVTARAVFVPVMQRSGQHVLIISIGLAIFLAEAVRLAQGSGRRWLSPVWNEPVPLLHAPDF
ncbi:MAG: hypothetical protein ACRCXM_03180, partial [Beijerinckiaceae bacterium]